MTTFDFSFGPVPAHKHVNGGGWVADTATVAATAYVGSDAQVYGSAQVCGSAQVYGSAQVFGSAQVYGSAQVCGSARVYGSAQVSVDPIYVHRSDGYAFTCFMCADGIPRITAGSRFFTFAQARDHWRATRAGTPLGEETFTILRFLRKRCSQLGWIEKPLT
jgi:hypothetical protein